MPKRVKVSLHLGAHRTASTHLQHTLSQNVAVLREASVKFVGPRQLRQKGQSLQRQFQLGKNQLMDPKKAAAVVDGLAQGAARVVLSEENLAGHMYRGVAEELFPIFPKADLRLEKLTRTLAAHEVRVFFALREPSSYIASAYSHKLLTGNYKSFEAFTDGVDPSLVQWSNLIERLRRVSGMETLYVWCYEDYPRLAPKIFRRMISWKHGGRVQPLSRRANGGFSARAVAEVLAAEDQHDDVDLGRRARNDFPVSDEFPRFSPWPEPIRRHSQAAYQADVAKIGAMDGVRLIGGKRMFDQKG